MKIEDIKTLIADISETVEKVVDVEGIEDDGTNVLELQSKLAVLTDSVDQMAEYLNKIQSEMDKSILPVLKTVIDTAIINYATAYDCTTFYTKGWFSRSLMSVEGKIEFASYLIKAITPYCKSNLETLEMIVNRNADMMLYISYFRNDD